jgi:polyphosphate kinase
MQHWDRYLNRDLSWLEFNRRVMNEALDTRTPLLERLRFLSIFQANLDEYFMKRIGSLYSQSRIRFREQLMPMLTEVRRCLFEDLLPQMRAEGIELIHTDQLRPDEKERADFFFEKTVFPVLTPLAVDPGHPFPFVSNLSLNLAVLLRHPEQDEEFFARVKVPSFFPQWIRVDGKKTAQEARFISLRQLVESRLNGLFPGMEILSVMPFRVTRDVNVERDEEDAEDLLEMITEELKERRFADVIRIEHGPNAHPRLLRTLVDELGLEEDQIFEVHGEIDYGAVKPILELNRPELKFDPWMPQIPVALADPELSMFPLIKKQDLLVHHPYESFSGSVERFIRSAVEDPKVLAIKMTLYRTGADSPFIPLLVQAAERGKHVAVVVEIKARGDEDKNILVAQALESAGVHVVYGVVGLKTHCKIALVVRQEPDLVRCYAHIGTGNYHSVTARLYTDFSYFTARDEITKDIVEVFHYLTGRSAKKNYHSILVSPVNQKEEIIQRIHQEAEHQKAGRPARIIAKMNQLEDRDVIDALYHASKAGVKIDLLIRGFCCLRPGVKNESDNITVTSIIGRFLEHSRCVYFANGEEDPLNGSFFIGSADWMSRNLIYRVEVSTPIRDLASKEKIWKTLQLMLEDTRQAWELQANGHYIRKKSKSKKKEFGSHAALMRSARSRV